MLEVSTISCSELVKSYAEYRRIILDKQRPLRVTYKNRAFAVLKIYEGEEGYTIGQKNFIVNLPMWREFIELGFPPLVILGPLSIRPLLVFKHANLAESLRKREQTMKGEWDDYSFEICVKRFLETGDPFPDTFPWEVSTDEADE